MSSDVDVTTSFPKTKLSKRWHWASNQAISFLMQQGVENPDVISLAAGLVDPASLPVEETRLAMSRLLGDDQRARQVLQYGTTAGAERLRSQLLNHLARLEHCSPQELGIGTDRLILTTGSQQLLSVVGDILLDPGDICLVAAPTYFVFLGVIGGLGAQAIPIATDEQGMCMDALEAELQRLKDNNLLDRVKLIYLVSYYENPSGFSLSQDRRERVVEIVRRFSRQQRIFILEDAAYRELHYDGPVLPSIWSHDRTHDSVILAQTFSKSFSPGLRVGFGVVPQELIGPICDRKGNEDFGSANFNQHVIATVLEEGLYEKHVHDLCVSYRLKRDSMLDAAHKYFADISGVHWVHPHGGLYVWMTLPDGVETGFESELFSHAVKKVGVMYVPGEICFAGEAQKRNRNFMRLSFGVETSQNIELGMQRLSKAVRAAL